MPSTDGSAHGVVPAGISAHRRLTHAVAGVLDVVIVVYALALVLSSVTDGVSVAGLSVSNAAKPLLVLALVLPVRAALPVRSTLVDASARGARAAAVWSIPSLRAPAAVVDALVALFATRAFSFVVAFMANLLLAPAAARGFVVPFENRKFAEIFAAWDSGWYFDIASRGYYFRSDGESSIAFFPLYPLLMRLAAWPFGGTERAIWTAGIVISCSAFALALVALHKLTEKLTGDRDTARRAVLYVAVFPFSLFFTRVYTESLFLLTTVVAISRAYDGKWPAAGLWGAAAALTRPNGILIAIPLALLAFRQPSGWRVAAARGAWVALVPAALAGHCAYVYALSGDPLAWLAAQSHWAYSLGHAPWQQLLKMFDRLVEHGLYGYFFVTPMAPFRLLHGAAALTFLALTPAVFLRFGVPLGCYVLASLVVPLTSDALEGIGRYAAVLFPVFMLVAGVKSQRLHESILIGGALLLGLLNCLFVTLHPIY